ncbi:tumor necrosis factor receptor superfamily member 14-like [Garra rufa]|uniref:tumor necrosis factor receptor superfamily member 14-like n=1 Tax=Garra rufa TaxID=137080 RepID=UPI003CCEDD06
MTYNNAPNGLTQCLPCSVCDSSNGLRVKQACTLTSNTVCEPLPGYYCTDFLSNCPKAIKHSTCSPGQYVNQTGTEFSDTVCTDCPTGSYSDGSLCKLHTKCESLGKTTVEAGTDTTDAECSNGGPSYLWILFLCGGYLFRFQSSELSVLTALFSLLPSLKPPTHAYISGEAWRISNEPNVKFTPATNAR